MKDTKMFNDLPEGFHLVENEVDYQLAALTITQAFADSKYPIPSIEMKHSSYMKYYNSLSKCWIDNALEHGFVLTNEDYSAVMILTPMKLTCNMNANDLSKVLMDNNELEAAENLKEILGYIHEDEKGITFDENTMYIEAFAVQTPRQGQKLGSKLMRKLFLECDKENRDVILFTNTDKNVSIYSHFGFTIMKERHEKELNSSTYFMIRKAHSEENH